MFGSVKASSVVVTMLLGTTMAKPGMLRNNNNPKDILPAVSRVPKPERLVVAMLLLQSTCAYLLTIDIFVYI